MKLTGAAILVSRGMMVLQAAPAAYPYRSATGGDGVSVELVDPGPPLTAERLAVFEAEVGVRLPPAYHQFLLRTNGGRPHPGWFRIPGWPGGASEVHWFLRVDDPHTKGLGFWVRELQDRLGDAWVPVAVDLGGNFVLVGLPGPDSDRVFYWDSSPDWGLDEATGTVFEVAADIDAFLGLLGTGPAE